MNSLKILVISAIATVLCSGCTPKDSPDYGIKTQVVAYEKLPINRTGIQVIQMADRVRVSVNSDAVFAGFSSKFKHNYRTVLRPLEDFLAKHQTFDHIVVSGYQSSVGNHNKLEKLSKQQADAVAAYIWAMGIPIEAIKVVAYGPRAQISDPATASGNVENRRIDIDIF